jgi:hypothetical protein
VPHIHLCIGPTRGPRHSPTARASPASALRALNSSASLARWDTELLGLRLWNGHGEQQATIVFPNPFLSADGKKVLTPPDWSRLDLWDELRFRYAGVQGPILSTDPARASATTNHPRSEMAAMQPVDKHRCAAKQGNGRPDSERPTPASQGQGGYRRLFQHLPSLW